jgi:hypothetical protein
MFGDFKGKTEGPPFARSEEILKAFQKLCDNYIFEELQIAY